MKYFTPERWLRFQNVDDEDVIYAAHADWEQATAAYRTEVARALPLLPADLRRFAESECLHDAVLLGDWMNGALLHLLVKPEPPANHRALLVYETTEAPEVVVSSMPRKYRTARAGWMYDEIGVESEGPAPVFRHAILLSDGREIAIRFRHFTFAHFPEGVSGTAVSKDPANRGCPASTSV